jgi:hypothetical protein
VITLGCADPYCSGSFVLRPETSLFTRRNRSVAFCTHPSLGSLLVSKIISVIVSFFASNYVMLWPKFLMSGEVRVYVCQSTHTRICACRGSTWLSSTPRSLTHELWPTRPCAIFVTICRGGKRTVRARCFRVCSHVARPHQQPQQHVLLGHCPRRQDGARGRAANAGRNVYTLCCCLSHAQGLLSKDKNELLFRDHQINYNDEPEMFRRGSILLRHTV